ncbi:2-methylaconitate cis-trans isomerase PrpF [Ideonella livida]|uniref:2-methylaconitate cis-trans isomerase PrpF n=1 Tax=Ideonella livida TaxID=2707176 RepID=A0A7C9PJG1_9BURK|nr:2-methylaconitate cis-trans isomerase PrpF [Ideonella livida]NDY93537.1 2-methylaconitate cis-trans isomerase PrpF [Ideonella livida]
MSSVFPVLTTPARQVGPEAGGALPAQARTGPLRIPAAWWRGGTSKGVFFRLQDLPADCQVPGPARDRLLLRVIGSPDPYGTQIDGLGGATSSTSKVVILSPATRPGHDVDYLFGQVAVDRPVVDWSGNCGNLSAAAGAFALQAGLVDPARVPREGVCPVRLWQVNTAKTLLAHVPVQAGQVLEAGDFTLDGVAFPAAEIVLEFLDPAPEGEGTGDGAAGAGLFPTGQVVDTLELPEAVVPGGRLQATLIQAGIPTVFIRAEDVGCTGTEGRDTVNADAALLARLEAIRVAGALRMGLIRRSEEAAGRQHTPKIALVAPPRAYTASNGRPIAAHEVDLLVRALSMGRLHHAMMGTASVAIAVAAAVPRTLVHQAAGGGPGRERVCFGHPAGTLCVGASAARVAGCWQVRKAVMSRSARLLMAGWVYVPAPGG